MADQEGRSACHVALMLLLGIGIITPLVKLTDTIYLELLLQLCILFFECKVLCLEHLSLTFKSLILL